MYRIFCWVLVCFFTHGMLCAQDSLKVVPTENTQINTPVAAIDSLAEAKDKKVKLKLFGKEKVVKDSIVFKTVFRDSVVVKYVYDTIRHIEPIPAKMEVILNYIPPIARETYVMEPDPVEIFEYEESFSFNDFDIPDQPDEFIQNKIENFPSLLPLVFNDKVRSQIDLFSSNDRNREWLQDVLGLQQIYFPIYERILEQNGVPVEVKYLSVIESGLNPKATSPAGAKGLWQFIPETAVLYGLKNNSYYDYSRDPRKATQAACEYLTKQYAEFGDWFLAMAAYNCGPGNVRKALRKGKEGADYWDIRSHLPRETRDYIPKFIAVLYLMENAEAHNLKAFTVEPDLVQTDTIHVHQKLDLKDYAKYTGASIDHLKYLNPILKTNVIHKPNPTFVLTVPYRSMDSYWSNRNVIFKYGNKGPAPVVNYQSYSTTTAGEIAHTVRKGQSIGGIARKYDVSQADIKAWNSLKSNIIHPDQILYIYKSDNTVTNSGTLISEDGVVNGIMNSNFFFHYIEKGQTLSNIAEQYDGVSKEDIRLFNELSYNAYLQPGESIKIPVK